MQESRICVSAILQERRFCAQIFKGLISFYKKANAFTYDLHSLIVSYNLTIIRVITCTIEFAKSKENQPNARYNLFCIFC